MDMRKQNELAQWNLELKRRSTAKSASYISFIPSTWRGKIIFVSVLVLFMWLMQDYAKKKLPSNQEKQKNAQVRKHEKTSTAINIDTKSHVIAKEDKDN